MAEAPLFWLPFLGCVFFLGSARLASSFEDKCAACRAVAVELEIGLLNERPHNHLDMRHRLNSKGQREGKLIDYKGSELRAVELLDGLCTKMKGYTLETVGIGKSKWIKTDLLNSVHDKQEADAYSKQMTTYCGRLLEDTEEELEERIKNGSMKLGEVENTLCWELSQQCSHPGKDKEVGNVPETDGEL